MNEQTENLSRVTSEIGQHVTAFLDRHLGQEFYCDELRRYVAEQCKGYIAPGSPDRILRDLRQKGVVDYEVVNRRKSLYKALPTHRQLELFQ